MRLSALVQSLTETLVGRGDINVYLQVPVSSSGESVAHESFFVVPEEYNVEDGGWAVNIRTWPY